MCEVTLKVTDLFEVLYIALLSVAKESKSETFEKMCEELIKRGCSKDKILSGRNYLSLREEFNRGFIVEEEKMKRICEAEIKNTRVVPFSQQETEENGLFWRDIKK